MLRRAPTKNKRRGRWLAGVIGVLMAGYAGAANSQTMDTPMPNAQTTLWQTIAALERQTPFTQAKIESTLGIRLNEAKRDEFAQFLEGGNVSLSGGVRISKIDLRIMTAPNHPGFLVIDIDGACVTLDQVRSHYAKLEITNTPRGRSLDEATSYTSSQSWGNLSFGFKERNRNCLAYVALDPKKGK